MHQKATKGYDVAWSGIVKANDPLVGALLGDEKDFRVKSISMKNDLTILLDMGVFPPAQKGKTIEVKYGTDTTFEYNGKTYMVRCNVDLSNLPSTYWTSTAEPSAKLEVYVKK